ncbi:MAG TPA: hypothetical protein VEY92_04325 [Pseudoxanthomonas sp.]|nr:hypothetical protein [Pseudoxanthomonas sp.]
MAPDIKVVDDLFDPTAVIEAALAVGIKPESQYGYWRAINTSALGQ